MTSRRQPIERPPSRVAGVVYIIIGFFALLIAAFILLYQGNLGAITNIRIGFGAVIAAYGLFRIFTGITILRRANAMKNSVPLNGNISGTKPPPA